MARFVVPQMSSRESADRIRACIRQLDGIHTVNTSTRTHTVTVRFQPLVIGIAEMMAVIERTGYSVADMVQSGAGGLARSIQFTVPEMECDFCADHLARSLRRLPGVVVVTTQVAAQHVTVRFAPEKVEAVTIKATVARAGYSMVDAVAAGA